jgi:hypothetical protein
MLPGAYDMKKFGIREKITAAITSFSIFYLMPVVSATTTMVSGTTGTFMGPLGIFISLGIENIPGVTALQARMYYNWICFAAVMWVALTSDRRNSTVFCVLAVIVSACTAAAGWFTVLLPDGSVNPAGPWGLIILCALLTVVSYMTETKRINFGITGAGDPIINIFTFFILFQGVIGLINGAAIFPVEFSTATPDYCVAGTNNFANCQINGATQLSNLQTNTGTGNILITAWDALTGMASIAWNAVLLVVQIAISLAFVSAIIVTTYPWIKDSVPAMALLSIMQILIWILYILTIARWYGKLGYGEGRL